jgi:hypothetical protein
MDSKPPATAGVKPTFGNVLPHVLLPIAMILGLASPPFRGRGVFWTTIIGYLVYRSLLDEFPSDIQSRYAVFQSWFWYMPTIQKLLCSEPEQAYWRLDKLRAEATHMSFGFEKLRWAAALLVNPRGIGWNFQIRGVPLLDYRKEQKSNFLIRQTLRLFQGYLLTETALLYLRTCKFPDVLDNITYGKQIVIGLVSGILVYGSWLFQWSTVSILGVASGLSKPSVRRPSLCNTLDTLTNNRTGRHSSVNFQILPQ